MSYWLRGQRGGALIFLLIAALVLGGLGWASVVALRQEQEQVAERAHAEQDRAQMDRERLAARARADRDKLQMERERLAAGKRAERARQAARAQAERERELDNKMRLALSMLDSRILTALVQEENRPYNHYSAVFASPLALVNSGGKWKSETVLEPSPLLSVALPDWILLHFQTDEEKRWGSPQILSPNLLKRLAEMGIERAPVTPERQAVQKQLFEDLNTQLAPKHLLELVQKRSSLVVWQESTLVPGQQAANTENPTNPQQGQSKQQQPGAYGGYDARQGTYTRAQNDAPKEVTQRLDANFLARNIPRNGEDWFSRGLVKTAPGGAISVSRGPMVRLWITTADKQERLVLARLVHAGSKLICQGIVLDWPLLQKVLAAEVNGLFPEARFVPMREDKPSHPERTMSALPIELDPGSVALVTQPEDVEPEEVAPGPVLELHLEAPVAATPTLGWTPLRAGLGLAWAAALIAMLAVGLGGWSLLDLSERRIRFVSAVTHELRTPLTTLRLYLDMLTGGLIKDERQKAEYLQTLHEETDRLNRLIANVLDFSRLEKQRPRLNKSTIAVGDLLDQVQTTWQRRCQNADKELVVDQQLAPGQVLETDVELVQQILGNLIDNACKYSPDAEDRRIWLRVRAAGAHQIVLEVEDAGPGIPARERQAIFRPFRRGRDAEVIAGGVGLGLALAHRWAQLLGGTLAVHDGALGGACFRFQLSVG